MDVAAAAPAANGQHAAQPAPADLAAAIWKGEDALKDERQAHALLLAVGAGNTGGYAVLHDGASRPVVLSRGQPLSELPLHPEAARLVMAYVASGGKTRGVVLGYSTLAGQAPLPPERPPGVAVRGAIGGRALPGEAGGGVLFYKSHGTLSCEVDNVAGFKARAH